MMTLPQKNSAKWMAIHRITALWAFCESGLGGVLHALKMPFTGLVVGSFSVICITLIAWFSERQYRRILQSLMLVLIIKAAVSPHSPPTAYFAVAFQGLIGFAFYSLIGVRASGIFSLSIVALLESALQKLLTLTLFTGRSIWIAADELVAYIGRELSIALPLGSKLMVGIYVLAYFVGGIVCGWMALSLVRDFENDKRLIPPAPVFTGNITTERTKRRKRNRRYFLLTLFVLTGIALYVFADNHYKGRLAVLQILLWTSCALLLWYGLVAPVLLRLLHRFLRRKRSQYSDQVQELLQLMPGMRRLSVAAWIESRSRKGFARIVYFVRLLVHWSLTWKPVKTEPGKF
jgi:hypothetical protein